MTAQKSGEKNDGPAQAFDTHSGPGVSPRCSCLPEHYSHAPMALGQPAPPRCHRFGVTILAFPFMSHQPTTSHPSPQTPLCSGTWRQGTLPARKAWPELWCVGVPCEGDRETAPERSRCSPGLPGKMAARVATSGQMLPARFHRLRGKRPPGGKGRRRGAHRGWGKDKSCHEEILCWDRLTKNDFQTRRRGREKPIYR